jgi:CHASE3 domain sensor protein
MNEFKTNKTLETPKEDTDIIAVINLMIKENKNMANKGEVPQEEADKVDNFLKFIRENTGDTRFMAKVSVLFADIFEKLDVTQKKV